MTDDNCGADTTGDQPCQNPAGENGRCWIPSHNPDSEEENPHGREFSVGEDDHGDILEAARKGKSKSGCARAAGVSHTELRRYLEAHDDFRSSFERARATGESKLIDGGLFDDEVDSSMAKFLLASSFDYTKTEKREVDVDADIDATHDVTADFVTYSPEDTDDD
jgi:hypothetical protein